MDSFRGVSPKRLHLTDSPFARAMDRAPYRSYDQCFQFDSAEPQNASAYE